jgi:protein TonB
MQKKWAVGIGGSLAVSVIVGIILGGFWLKNHYAGDDSPQKKQIQQITVLTPPPPPPPPPPPKMQEPEIEEQQPIEEQIEDALPDQGEDAPAGEELGVDADGSAGSDGFGLRAKKGGRGLLGGGGYYANVKQELNEYLLKHPQLKYMEYVAVITLWIGDKGTFDRYEIKMQSGDAEAEVLLNKAIAEMRRVSKPRPFEVGNRVSLRLTSSI